jgi:hypothetical protein
LLAIPVVIFTAILAWLGNLFSLPEGTIVFSQFLPIVYNEVVFVAALSLSMLGAVLVGDPILGRDEPAGEEEWLQLCRAL